MPDSTRGLAVLLTGCLWATATQGCRRPTPPTPATTRPTVASTVPAATDLLVGMGCGDHLVAVSNYDLPRPEIPGLRKAGDLQSIDWEVIEAVSPTWLITGNKPDRRPAGFDDRAARDHVRPVFLQVNRLEDIDPAIRMLGSLVNEDQKAAAAVKKLDDRLNAVRLRAAGHQAIPTLVVTSEDPTSVAGPQSYLDELLTVAGGINVVRDGGPYPTLDREKLLSLHPQVIIQLIHDATPAQLAEAAAAWKNLPGITAPVHVITDTYAVQPGWHVADLAEKMADDLGQPASGGK